MDIIYFLNFVIFYHSLGTKGQYEKPICGLPGLPFRGNITPFKNEYEFDDIVVYKCDVGYNLDGPRYNLCNKYSVWKNEVPPLCRKNFARNSKPFASATNEYFSPSAAIDGYPSTCTKISAGVDKKRGWWSVYFYQIIDVEVVSIYASSGNGVYNMSLYLRDSSNKLNKCANIQTRKKREDNLNEKTKCNGYSDFLYIEDQRLYEYAVFQLCEVAVYSKPVMICGEPDRNPNCLTKNVSTATKQLVQYYPRIGYQIGKEKVTRMCSDFKWIPSESPYCSPIPGYSTVRTGTNIEENSTEIEASTFLIGAIIGAAISIILIIGFAVVGISKYYKYKSRESNAASTTNSGFPTTDQRSDDTPYSLTQFALSKTYDLSFSSKADV